MRKKMKYKYRIIKESDNPYYKLERKPSSRFKWFENILQWEYVDLDENLQYLENKAERMIKKDNEILTEITIVIVKEYFNVD